MYPNVIMDMLCIIRNNDREIPENCCFCINSAWMKNKAHVIFVFTVNDAGVIKDIVRYTSDSQNMWV